VNTPIYDFANEYRKSGSVRLHMPGHKGVNSPLGVEELDITEFDGADNLWEADGIIKESESNASMLFGANTFYSTEGSSLCIRAMLFMVKKWAYLHNIIPLILAARNAHKTFINTAMVLDIDVDWLMPKETDTYESCTIDANDISKYISETGRIPVAVYITSPDYLGNVLDIDTIAKVCHENNILLLVDNAHGAYLKFLNKSLHPMDLGADICCDSAHKTLPALTGASYLHVSDKTDPFFKDNAKDALALFASTSPSYLIMESLDLTNRYLDENIKSIQEMCSTVYNLKNKLVGHGYSLKGDEPLKITIDAMEYGYTGDELAQFLMEDNIYLEYHDENFIVAMVTTNTSEDELNCFYNALVKIPKKNPLSRKPLNVTKPIQALKPSEVLYMEAEEIPSSLAVGRILAKSAMSCPPCVPVYIAGEIIDKIPETEYVKVIKKGESK